MSTGIDPAAVLAFSNKGEEVRGHMKSTLSRTQASVDAAISPAVWGGQASSAFGDVTARYQQASAKLNSHMEEILNSVKKGSKDLTASDESTSHAVGNVNI